MIAARGCEVPTGLYIAQLLPPEYGKFIKLVLLMQGKGVTHNAPMGGR